MVQRYQTHSVFLLICGLLVAISLLLAGVPDVQAQASDSCPEGQIWSLNRCTDVEETTCQTGYTYVADHGCVLIEEDDSTCPSGYEMTGGRCQVIGQSCPAGETWRDGSCQTRDEESCPAGKERVNGSCFQITDTVCPVGYSWSDSKDRCDDDDDDEDEDEDDDTGSSTGTGSGTGSNSYVIPSVLAFSDTTLTVEEGCNVTYTVALKSKPSDDATVALGLSLNTILTAEPATLTFTPDTWDVPQIVTVTCAEDDDAVDNSEYVSNSVSGVDYECVPAPLVKVEVTDNDTKGVTLSESALTIEEGGTGTYTVQLDSEPTGNIGNVIVTINDPTDDTHVTTAPEFLTFTILNWNNPQTVTVTALEEEDAGDDEATVTHSVSGSFYGGRVTAADVTVSVTDNDIRGVTLSESNVTVYEGGTGTYAVQLDTEPTGTVTVTINDPTDNTDVTTDPATLTFTTLNWNNPQTVTVTAAEEEEDDEGDTVRQLLNGRGFPHFLDEGKSALFYAVENESPNAFDALLEHADVDPNVVNGDGDTPLFRAVEYGRRDYIRKLLDRSDTDPNAYAGVIHVSILSSRDNDIMKMLLEHPHIDPNQQAWDGRWTPLRMAVQYTSTSSVKLLLAHPDIDPSIEDNEGYTPLERACFYGYRDEIVEMLEEHEAE